MTDPATQATARTIVVMARPLVRGAVKTRLATALGDDGALAVYERLLHGTLDAAEQVPGASLVLAEAPVDGASRRAERPPRPPTRSPGEAAAGRDSRSAATDSASGWPASSPTLFAAGAAAVVAVNSDSPALPPEYLAQAFRELSSRRPRPWPGGRRRLLPHRRRPADLGCRRRAPAVAARRVAHEQPGAARTHAARGAEPPASASRSSRSGSTSTSRRTSASSTGSRDARRRAASRSRGCERSTCTSPTAAAAPACTATTRRPRPTTS